MMTEQELRKRLTTATFGKKVFLFDRLDSTNTYAKELASTGSEEGTLVVAEDQYAGRGRLGRTWVAEAGTSLTFSVILRPTISPEHIGILSLYAGLAVTEAIALHSSIAPACKWPNDVLLEGKKFCGILSEAVFHKGKLAAAIIGVGLNVNQLELPQEIRHLASSMAIANGRMYDRVLLLAEILGQLERWYGFVQSGQYNTILERWCEHSPMIGKQITINQQGTIIQGIATRLVEDGGLMVQTNGKELKMLVGDVTIVK